MSDTNNTQAAPPAKPPTLTAPPPANRLVVVDTGPTSYLMDTARFDHTFRIARMMALSSLIPKHLVVNGDFDATASNCFRVCNQAIRWGMDPFAVIDETYVGGGKLGYQGKLVAAVVNALAGLQQRLRAEYTGAGEDRRIKVIGRFANENADRTIELTLKDVKTDNKMWKTQPDQKLYYTGATQWARRHCPEVMLGILTDDDVDHISASEADRRLRTNGRTSSERAAALTNVLAASQLPAPPVAPSPTPDESPDTEILPADATTPENGTDGEIDPDLMADDYLSKLTSAATIEVIDTTMQEAHEDVMVLGAQRLEALKRAAESSKKVLKKR